MNLTICGAGTILAPCKWRKIPPLPLGTGGGSSEQEDDVAKHENEIVREGVFGTGEDLRGRSL